MTQSWHDLLVAHWAVEAGVLRALAPAALPIEWWRRLEIHPPPWLRQTPTLGRTPQAWARKMKHDDVLAALQAHSR